MKKQELKLVEEEKSKSLFSISKIIEDAPETMAVFVNQDTTLPFWSLSHQINTELKTEKRLEYGAQIRATLSQLLNLIHEKWACSALTHMSKVVDILALEEKTVETDKRN